MYLYSKRCVALDGGGGGGGVVRKYHNALFDKKCALILVGPPTQKSRRGPCGYKTANYYGKSMVKLVK